MNDRFLTMMELPIPAGLEDRIRERIAALESGRDAIRGKGRVLGRIVRWSTQHGAVAAGAGLLFLAACTAGIVKIGGFMFAQGATPLVEPPEGVEAVPQRMVSRAEALEAVTFEVGLPTWVPEAYEMTDEAMVTLPSADAPLSEAWQVWLYWEAREGSYILLVAFPSAYYRGDAAQFGPESVQEVDLAGVRGAAVRGNWSGSGRTWNESAGGNVLWVRGDTAYWIQSSWVQLEDLVHMARSVP